LTVNLRRTILPFIPLSLYPFIPLSLYPFIPLSLYPFIPLSLYPFIPLSLYFLTYSRKSVQKKPGSFESGLLDRSWNSGPELSVSLAECCLFCSWRFVSCFFSRGFFDNGISGAANIDDSQFDLCADFGAQRDCNVILTYLL